MRDPSKGPVDVTCLIQSFSSAQCKSVQQIYSLAVNKFAASVSIPGRADLPAKYVRYIPCIIALVSNTVIQLEHCYIPWFITMLYLQCYVTVLRLFDVVYNRMNPVYLGLSPPQQPTSTGQGLGFSQPQ